MRRYNIVVNGREYNLDVQELGAERFRVGLDGEILEVELRSEEDLFNEEQITPAILSRTLAQIANPDLDSSTSTPAPLPPVRPATSAGNGSAIVKAPMPGVIVETTAVVGMRVSRGESLVVLEAMKMKNAIRAPRDGVVAEICVRAGQNVGHGETLVRFEEQG